MLHVSLGNIQKVQYTTVHYIWDWCFLAIKKKTPEISAKINHYKKQKNVWGLLQWWQGWHFARGWFLKNIPSEVVNNQRISPEFWGCLFCPRFCGFLEPVDVCGPLEISGKTNSDVGQLSFYFAMALCLKLGWSPHTHMFLWFANIFIYQLLTRRHAF